MTRPTLIRRISDLRAALSAPRREGQSIGLVPTMGYLHRGHMALVDRARGENGIVVVSIFVNPTQFGPNEDLDIYPRDLDGDLKLCAAHGVDIVFAPEVDDMYPEPMATTIDVAPLSTILIGAQRPGHFQGVATVVAKLFNIVQPTRAYFGEKDFQQLTVVRRMVRDLSFDIAIVGVPTVREADGLAASSRNARLSPADRHAATVVSRALDLAEALVAGGERDSDKVADAVRQMIAGEKRAGTPTVDLREAGTLSEVGMIGETPVVVLVTVPLGGVLLLDQREIHGAAGANQARRTA
ncbi:pantothenate synthetase [Aureimonas sp. SA4125]|uniref:pantoate--beta-alanine ligase n=1 Tax=Aureimonas sp. SA4125 TaxID=2826993 RepID=UPI001CC40BF5|nr:pantoate--beta-alanine ligase [Aureimonas sp. SA4125]BDA83836.1 pantothenate synthetase [Aureimonas sp. SA4125]